MPQQTDAAPGVATARPTRRGDPATLLAAARTGDVVALSYLLSHLEDAPDPAGVLDLVPAVPDEVRIVGLTGPPGAGKSTLTATLVRSHRRCGRRVAVLAVDPSSTTSGGALLGDRVRMTELSDDDGVFVRSVAARGHLGGLAVRLPALIRALAWSGFDEVIVETVGVGQSETAVGDVVDTTVVVLSPGQGDGVQAAKAGILEIADVYAVNKADQPGADQVVRDLRSTVLYARPAGAGEWHPAVVRTVATGPHVDELDGHLDRHAGWLRQSGLLRARRRACVQREIRGIVEEQLAARLDAALRLVGDEGSFSHALVTVQAELAAALGGRHGR